MITQPTQAGSGCRQALGAVMTRWMASLLTTHWMGPLMPMMSSATYLQAKGTDLACSHRMSLIKHA